MKNKKKSETNIILFTIGKTQVASTNEIQKLYTIYKWLELYLINTHLYFEYNACILFCDII
jgi:hypothetical protein